MAYKNVGLYLAFLHFYSCVCLGELISLKIRTSVGSIIIVTRVMITEILAANPKI